MINRVEDGVWKGPAGMQVPYGNGPPAVNPAVGVPRVDLYTAETMV